MEFLAKVARVVKGPLSMTFSGSNTGWSASAPTEPALSAEQRRALSTPLRRHQGHFSQRSQPYQKLFLDERNVPARAQRRIATWMASIGDRHPIARDHHQGSLTAARAASSESKTPLPRHPLSVFRKVSRSAAPGLGPLQSL